VPRRNRPKKRRGRAAPGSDEEPEALRAPDIVTGGPEGWQVRVIQPASATKEYRCPGCNQEIRAGTKHVVAWREDDLEGRRHWHLPCWQRQRK
jgi:hypothetical protein